MLNGETRTWSEITRVLRCDAKKHTRLEPTRILEGMTHRGRYGSQSTVTVIWCDIIARDQ